MWDLECYDLTCKIESCEKCNENPQVCEQCAKGYWLDKENNDCINEAC